MHVVNHGPLAAALILAGVTLPDEFNLEDSVVARHDDALRQQYPKLDKEAINALACVAAGKDLMAELSVKKDQATNAVLAAGGQLSDAQIYTDHKNAVLSEISAARNAERIANVRKAAEEDILKEQGFVRNDKGELVPVNAGALIPPDPLKKQADIATAEIADARQKTAEERQKEDADRIEQRRQEDLKKGPGTIN